MSRVSLAVPETEHFDGGRIVANVTDPRITEASGIAVSRRHLHTIYTFNDSGGKNRSDTHARTHARTHTRTRVRAHTHAQKLTHARTHAYTHAHTHTRARAHTRTETHTRTHVL